MEIQELAKKQREEGHTDHKLDALNAMNVQDRLLAMMSQCSDMFHEIEDIRNTSGLAAKDPAFADRADEAIAHLKKSSHFMDDMLDTAQRGVDTALTGLQIPNLHKYIRMKINGDYFLKQGKYSYLFMFPRQATECRETCVWLPKQFCTKRNNDFELRFYDDTAFRMFRKDDPKQSRMLTADEFVGIVLSSKAFLSMTKGEAITGMPEYVTESGNTYTAVPGRSGKYHR
ncbi:MAG: hypothetical protein SOZ08_06985 [Erysipelotrichaceae bacterium]|nr:hypothetical protein [Erysipelotrichaceae bacterium]